MGWIKQANGKPRIYGYANGVYEDPQPLWFSWMTGSLWVDNEVAACFVNDYGRPVIISQCGVKICSCDSGGRGYWAWGGYISTPVRGYGAKYSLYVRVHNPGKPVEESHKTTLDIPNIGSAASSTYDAKGKLLRVSSNMNYPGSGPTQTAQFGDAPYGTGSYSEYTGMTPKSFNITECPVIEPGGKAYIHLRIHNFKGPVDNIVIRFLLDPNVMDVTIEPAEAPYIWVKCADGRWHLKSPAKVKTNKGTWEDI